MADPKQDDKQGSMQAPQEGEQPLRHEGGGRETLKEQKSGPQPEGNGGTGKPAAFPPHN